MVDKLTSWLEAEIRCADMIRDDSGVRAVFPIALSSSIHKIRIGNMAKDGAYSGRELRCWDALLRSPDNA